MNKTLTGAVPTLILAVTMLSACSSEETANQHVACQLDAFNQCADWVNLTSGLVGSLSNTCVNDDGGVVIDACSTDNVVGICEQVGDPVTPDLINYFYLPVSASDPVAYAAIKEQACIAAGGVWVPQ